MVYPAAAFAQPEGVDVSGGFFSDPGPGQEESESAANPGPAAPNPMLPRPSTRQSVYAPSKFNSLYDGLGEQAESEEGFTDPSNMFDVEKDELPPQKELATRAVQIISGQLDPFQKAQLSLIKRAQGAPKTDNKPDDAKLKPYFQRMQQELIRRKDAITRRAAEMQRQYEKHKQGLADGADEKAIEVAAFGLDDLSPQGPGGSGATSAPDSAAALAGSSEDVATDSGGAPIVVSLYVNAEPQAEAERELQELAKLRAERKVNIGDVVFVGLAESRAREYIGKMVRRDARVPVTAPNNRRGRDSKGPGPAPVLKGEVPFEIKMMKKYQLRESGFVSVQDLFQRLKVKISPVWIVRSGGKDHLLEGRSSIWSMITKDGRFVGPDPLAADNLDTSNIRRKYQSPSTLETDPTPIVRYEVPGGGADFKLSRYNELRLGM